MEELSRPFKETLHMWQSAVDEHGQGGQGTAPRRVFGGNRGGHAGHTVDTRGTGKRG